MHRTANRSRRRRANRRTFLRCVIAILVAASFCRCGPRCWAASPDAPPAAPFRIVAYVFGGTDIPRIGAEKLTHANFAFGHVSTDSQVVLDNPRSKKQLAELIALKAKNHDLKVILSVGGWGADNFSDAALTDESRSRFAQSAVDVIKSHELDGVDLDWEYPGQPGPGIKFRPEDKQNFTLLLESLRKHFDAYDREQSATPSRHTILTIASASGDYFAHTEMDRLHKYLDWINVMTYDFYNSASHTTGHHTGLFRSADYPADFDAHWAAQAIDQHIAAGIPAEKMVLGAAFYGHGWSGVDPARHGIGQPYEKHLKDLSYAKLVDDYIDKNGFERRWDDSAQAPYLWNATSRTFISYDDPESLAAKVRYARAHNLGGMMYWQHGHDPQERLLSAIYEAAHAAQ